MKKSLLSDYVFYKELNLTIEAHKGVVVPNSFTSFKILQAEDKNYSKDYNNITDLRNVVFDITLDNVKGFLSHIKANNHKLSEGKKVAVLVATPNQFIYASVFAKMQNRLAHQIKFFFSLEKALQWMDGPYTNQFIENEIKQLLLKPKIVYEMDYSY